MSILRVFLGTDPRQPVAVQVLAHSIAQRASKPVAIIPLVIEQLPVKRTGLTSFTFSRYLVPYLCDYEGEALFLDSDMLCLGDVYELEDICRQGAGVCVVKNPKMRFEWPSLMYFNNALCRKLTLELIETGNPQALEWSEKVGEIPSEWNHLIGYDPPRDDAKICHFTAGIPCFQETDGCEYEQEWRDELRMCNSTVPWVDIMGGSVHQKPVMERMARLKGNGHDHIVQ